MSPSIFSNKLRWTYLPECETPPAGWVVNRLAALARVIAGQSPPSETYNDNRLGLPFLQGNADFSSRYPIAQTWCSAPAKIANEGDTLISVRAPVGEVNRADQEYAIGRGLAAIRATDSADADFIYYAMQRWRWSLQRVAQGTTFDAVTARHFAQLIVTAPQDIEEQAAIARVLDAVDSAISLARATAQASSDLGKALVQEFLYSALGVTAYADRPTKDLPAGWSLLSMDKLICGEPKNGISPNATSQPPGFPTFSIAAVRNGRVDLMNPEYLKYTEIRQEIAEKYAIRVGDTLIVRGNANPDLIGKAGRVEAFPAGCIYPDITKRVVLKTDGGCRLLPEFAILVWNHSIVHNQILRRAKTSNGTLKINNRDVKKIIVPVPPMEEQQNVVGVLSAVESKVDAVTRIEAALTYLKKSLMHDLLTGAVRVTGRDLPPPP